MYVRTLHNLTTGHILARGHDLKPGDTLATLTSSELLDIDGLWNTVTFTRHSDHKVTIHARDGITTTYLTSPDIDVTIYIVR